MAPRRGAMGGLQDLGSMVGADKNFWGQPGIEKSWIYKHRGEVAAPVRPAITQGEATGAMESPFVMGGGQRPAPMGRGQRGRPSMRGLGQVKGRGSVNPGAATPEGPAGTMPDQPAIGVSPGMLPAPAPMQVDARDALAGGRHVGQAPPGAHQNPDGSWDWDPAAAQPAGPAIGTSPGMLPAPMPSQPALGTSPGMLPAPSPDQPAIGTSGGMLPAPIKGRRPSMRGLGRITQGGV